MASIFIKTIGATTINLSPFFSSDISGINIDWGDGVVNESKTHTYSSKGSYTISSYNFEAITNIGNNVSFPNVEYLFFKNWKFNLFTIGNYFLSGNSSLKYLDMSEMKISSIGTYFLNNCSISILKLPYIKKIVLSSWGSNPLSSTAKIFCGIYDEYYKTTIPWKTYASKINGTLMEYKQIYKNNITEKTISKTPFYENGYLDLTELPILKSAINNGTVLLKNNLPEYVISSTKQIYHKNVDLQKTYFIYGFKYRFSYDKGITFTNKFIYNRYFQALYTEGNKLYVKSFIPETSFYLKENEKNIDFSLYETKYISRDVIENISDGNYIERMRYKLCEWHDLEDPNFAMGKLKFGIISDTVIKILTYEGDVETGFTFKIIAQGICKNPVLWSNIANSDGEKPFIQINTDKMPEGSIIKGDIILINTRIGKKSAKLYRNGVEINIMKYIDIKSSWLKIRHGENPFFMRTLNDADFSGLFNINCSIIYTDLFEGI